MNEGHQHIKITKTIRDKVEELEDMVAIEAPLEIQIKLWDEQEPRAISVTMRTPGDDEELALGFLFTEGILRNYNAVKAVKYLGENIVRIYLKEGESIDLKNSERNFYTTSSCGVCGKASIEAIQTISQYAIPTPEEINPEVFYSLKSKLADEQSLFTLTGGIHAAAIFSNTGDLEHLQEDVGRHNALDKVIGNALRRGTLPLAGKILMLSGRASFELIQKATMAGIETIVAVGAPSSLAVELSRKNGQQLLGFLKENRFNRYA